MSFLEFIKYYYKKSHKNLPDELVGRSTRVTKKQRIPTIIFSYLFLLLILITLPFVIIYCKDYIFVMMLVLYFSFALVLFIMINEADFNLLLILICYNIYKKDSIYCRLLKNNWFTGNLISILQQNINIKGLKYGRMTSSDITSKLRIVCHIPYNGIKVKMIFKSNMIIVKYNKNKKIFKELYETNRLLFDDIRSFILSVSN